MTFFFIPISPTMMFIRKTNSSQTSVHTHKHAHTSAIMSFWTRRQSLAHYFSSFSVRVKGADHRMRSIQVMSVPPPPGVP